MACFSSSRAPQNLNFRTWARNSALAHRPCVFKYSEQVLSWRCFLQILIFFVVLILLWYFIDRSGTPSVIVFCFDSAIINTPAHRPRPLYQVPSTCNVNHGYSKIYTSLQQTLLKQVQKCRLIRPTFGPLYLCSSCCTEVWHIPTQTDQTGWSSGPNPAPDPPGHCWPGWGCCCTDPGPVCRWHWSRCRSKPAGRPRRPPCWWCCRWGCRWTPCCAFPLGWGNWGRQLLWGCDQPTATQRRAENLLGQRLSFAKIRTIVISLCVQLPRTAVDGVLAVVGEVWSGPGVGEPWVVPHVGTQQVGPWMRSGKHPVILTDVKHGVAGQKWLIQSVSLPSIDDSRSFTVGETNCEKKEKKHLFLHHRFTCMNGFRWIHQSHAHQPTNDKLQ